MCLIFLHNSGKLVTKPSQAQACKFYKLTIQFIISFEIVKITRITRATKVYKQQHDICQFINIII